jgi:WD40 repeat protein
MQCFEHQLTFRLDPCPDPFALSPDGKVLVTGGLDSHTVHVWDIQTGQLVNSWIAAPPLPHYGAKDGIRSLAISGDGLTLVTGGRLLKAWELATGKQIRVFKSAEYTIDINISANSQILVTGSIGSTIIWDLKQGKKIRRRIGDIIIGWVASPDGKTVVGEDYFDNAIRVWDVATGSVLCKLDNKYGIRVLKVVFSSDGKLLASSGSDGIKIWNSETGEQIQRVEKYRNVRFHQHLDGVISVIFSPDNKYLLSSGTDGLIQVWDTNTGKNAGTIPGEYRINRIAASNDGRTLIGFDRNTQGESLVEVWKAKN